MTRAAGAMAEPFLSNRPKGGALKIFLSAGEASGDRQAAAMVAALRQLRNNLEIWAVGGSRLAAAGAEIWLDSRHAAVMGALAALAKAPALIPKLMQVKRQLQIQRPDVAVLVDWGGVNVRVARWLKELEVPTLYYLPPRAWDRRARRDVAYIVDAIATQFPWSKHILSGEKARVEWVGHPLVDLVQPQMTKREAAAKFCLDLARPIVALLPGSRKAEIQHCLPVLFEAANRIEAAFPQSQFLIPASEQTRRHRPLLADEFRQAGLTAVILEDMDYDALQCAGAAAAVSGTATLELALLGIPMVVFYRVALSGWLQYEIARRTTVSIQFFALPNLVANREVVKELMQYQASPQNLADEVIGILSDERKRDRIKDDLATVCRQLGPPGATRRAAEMVLDLVAYGTPAPVLNVAGASAAK